MFQIGDLVTIKDDSISFEYVPEIFKGKTGKIINIEVSTDFYEEEDSSTFYEYLVAFDEDCLETFWILEEELLLVEKRTVKQTGFSKFIQKIEG